MFEQQQGGYQQQPAYGGQQPGYDPDYEQRLSQLKPRSKAPWVLMLLVLAGAGAGGYYLMQDRDKARAEATAATNSADGAKKALEEKLKALEAEKAELGLARDALQKTVESKSSELAELKGTYDKLNDKMKDEIAHGDIILTQNGPRLRVDLVDKILFDSGDARISKRGESVLARVGAVLAQIDDKQIQVSGHTDNNPISDKLKKDFPTNWELSVSRATNVVRFLEDTAKVPAEHLMASGYGEHQPIASNRTPQGRARNRRIEILLTPSLAPKQISKAKLKEQEGASPAASAAAPAAAPAKSEPKSALAARSPKRVASAHKRR
jgi:chemotaxis protein MotB